MTDNMRTDEFRQAVLNNYWNNNSGLFSNLHKPIIYDILRALDKYGDVPSVLAKKWQIELNPPWYAILAAVTLAEHTINVAQYTMGAFDLRDNSIHAQDAIIVALGHDIAKSPLLRHPNRGQYFKVYHAWDSAEYIRTIIAGRLPEKELMRIYNAIYDHHSSSRDRLTNELQNADRRAREFEGKRVELKGELNVTMVPQVYQEMQWDEYRPTGRVPNPKAINAPWLDLTDFLRHLGQMVNNAMNKDPYDAFSMPNGYCYCRPEAVVGLFKKLAEEAGCIELAYEVHIVPEMRQDVLAMIAVKLRDVRAFADNLLPADHYCWKYTIKFKENPRHIIEKQCWLMPIRAEAFTPNLMMLERKKRRQITEWIESVRSGNSKEERH